MEEINDLIILGRSWPELLRDGRYSVCVAGYSKEHGFIRLYPTKIFSPLKTWNIVRVKVERNRADTRKESWKIVGSKEDWKHLDKNIKILGVLKREERINLLRNLSKDSTETLRNQGRSLGLVKPEILSWNLEDTGLTPPVQTTLTGLKLKTKKHFRNKPYIEYRCLPACESKSPHCQQLIEWGAYMWLNKQKTREDQEKVFDNLKLNDKNWEKYFLVGNLAYKRKTFAIISVMHFKK
ncbi:MAG: hypothetical protein NT120_03380 [Candidatus Aenigmarchaeota archaeon]|nr:hypothetical protein [Candidatus Aenigmarchaeota archaeon]